MVTGDYPALSPMVAQPALAPAGMSIIQPAATLTASFPGQSAPAPGPPPPPFDSALIAQIVQQGMVALVFIVFFWAIQSTT
jgi:hypothetical protein